MIGVTVTFGNLGTRKAGESFFLRASWIFFVLTIVMGLGLLNYVAGRMQFSLDTTKDVIEQARANHENGIYYPGLRCYGGAFIVVFFLGIVSMVVLGFLRFKATSPAPAVTDTTLLNAYLSGYLAAAPPPLEADVKPEGFAEIARAAALGLADREAKKGPKSMTEIIDALRPPLTKSPGNPGAADAQA
jgi:hypothetical protein